MRLRYPNDLNFSIKSKKFGRLIKKLSYGYEVGIHPSLFSHKSMEHLKSELKTLQERTKRKITRGRQHFIKMKWPHTYRSLQACGIREDFSMGFHDMCGFRAGTAHPFLWFDLEKNEASDLLIHPFQVMDVTLQMYEKLDVEKAIERVELIKEEVRKVGGSFTFIWHNSSFAFQYGWKGWEDVFETCLK
jgi:hypothetical protein